MLLQDNKIYNFLFDISLLSAIEKIILGIKYYKMY